MERSATMDLAKRSGLIPMTCPPMLTQDEATPEPPVGPLKRSTHPRFGLGATGRTAAAWGKKKQTRKRETEGLRRKDRRQREREGEKREKEERKKERLTQGLLEHLRPAPGTLRCVLCFAHGSAHSVCLSLGRAVTSVLLGATAWWVNGRLRFSVQAVTAELAPRWKGSPAKADGVEELELLGRLLLPGGWRLSLLARVAVIAAEEENEEGQAEGAEEEEDPDEDPVLEDIEEEADDAVLEGLDHLLEVVRAVGV
eukprot:Skav223543  [mRNA]  locus=scaffold1657:5577:9782:- [translate_table: standard]